jgi:SagB-type dehydrogenase family enzyme
MKDPFPKIIEDIFEPFVYPVKNKQLLNRNFNPKPKDFLSTMIERRSSRSISKLTLVQLEELLFYSCKITSIDLNDSGFIKSKRITPSAGARHPVDLLISLPDDLRTLNYYNPLDHSLSELLVEQNILDDFFSTIDKNLSIENACVIWFSIQTNKTASKYGNPESLYWKDTGALLYCIQLMATYLGLKSCPLGTLSSSSFNKLFKDSSIVSGGGIIIGI